MAKANIADIFRGLPVSNSDTSGREQIVYLDEAILSGDEKNFYELSDIESLAANIELIGLQQPIRVRPDPDNADGYLIVSGHRRMTAIRHLMEDDAERWRTVPCIIEDRPEESDAMRELRLIYANSDTRKMSSADISKQAERVEALLYQLKEEGVEFPGRMRDHVAEACKVSTSKLARLKVIREGLVQPEYIRLWEAGKLNESAAYELARFSPEMQTRIYAAVKIKIPDSYSLGKVREKVDGGCDYSSCSKSCKEHNPCTHNIRFLAHDLNDYYRCGTNKCCNECEFGGKKDPRYYGALCNYACPTAKKKFEAKKEDVKNKKLDEEQRALLERKKGVREFSSRILRAANSAHLSGKIVVHPKNGRGVSIAEYMTWASGDIADACWAALDYNNCGKPYYVSEAVKLADELHCSVDYLLGRVPDISPNAGFNMLHPVWMPGGTNPAHPCDCVVIFDLGNGDTFRQICRWDGECFRFSKRKTGSVGETIELQPIKWTELPPEEVDTNA